MATLPTNDSFKYFTTWSLLVSYSILIWTLILTVPKWLFLFAACFLTTTSVLGTFFLTIPTAKIVAKEQHMTITNIMLDDACIHSGPLILFLLLFPIFSSRVIPGQMTKRDYFKMTLIAVIVVFAYLGYIKFEQVYFYEYFTLVILCACIYVTSFQIYSNLFF
jgi:hypothetical protein